MGAVQGAGRLLGGAAAAVASGFTSFEIGTDIGGSIRIPASFNGIFGHKPSFGATPATGYLDEPLGGGTVADVNVIGPLARSSADLGLLMDVMAGPTDDAAHAWRLELPPPRHDTLSGYRIAAWLDDESAPVSADQHELLAGVAAALEAGGAVVDRTARPALELRDASTLGLKLIGAAVSLSATDDASRRRIEHRDWLAAHRDRMAMRTVWSTFFRDYDALLAPVCVSPPFPHDHEPDWSARRVGIDGESRPYLDLLVWTMAIGVNYLPVSVPPIGRTAAGLPVGVQIVGPYLEDRTCIDLAGHVERLLGGFVPPPRVA